MNSTTADRARPAEPQTLRAACRRRAGPRRATGPGMEESDRLRGDENQWGEGAGTFDEAGVGVNEPAGGPAAARIHPRRPAMRRGDDAHSPVNRRRADLGACRQRPLSRPSRARGRRAQGGHRLPGWPRRWSGRRMPKRYSAQPSASPAPRVRRRRSPSRAPLSRCLSRFRSSSPCPPAPCRPPRRPPRRGPAGRAADSTALIRAR